jgi:hypothetical protein
MIGIFLRWLIFGVIIGWILKWFYDNRDMNRSQILEIAEGHKWYMAGIVISISMLLIGFLQIDHMWWTLISYDEACKRIWVPELGLSYKDCFELFGTMIIFSIFIMLISAITWKKRAD